MSVNQIKAVVFDWAGTMVDHGCCAPLIALRDVFAEQGLALSDKVLRAEMGMAKRDHIRAILEKPEVATRWLELHRRAANEDDVSQLHDAVEPKMQAAAKACSTLIPGALDTYLALRAQGVKIGSSTGYTRTMMTDILPLAAAQGYAPDVVICAGETLAGRPSPLMMWKALVELGVYPSEHSVKVDDAVVGIQEGRAAHAWTIGLAASGNGVGLSHQDLIKLSSEDRKNRVEQSALALREAGADYVIESVADLMPVLADIENKIARGDRPGQAA